MKLIPVTQELAHKTEDFFAKTPFNNPENFVLLYTQGIVNKRSNSVRQYLNLVLEAYKNIESKGGNIVYLSAEEVDLTESLEMLGYYIIPLRLKRVATVLAEKGYTDETEIFFTPKHRGFLAVLSDTDDSVERVESESLYTNFSEIAVNPFLRNKLYDHPNVTDGGEPVGTIRLGDLLAIDASKITEVRGVL